MDPNANLEEQITLAKQILERQDAFDPDVPCEYEQKFTENYYTSQADAAERLAELVEALHEWIKKGGFLPKEWQR
jgi:hypothetical protein